eukprot:1158402-Pelagomonas_calceolata.AAC.1
MLKCLDLYARRKHLAMSTAKSEVVHFNSSGSNLPVFSVGGVPLAHKESFKYLGMWFHKNISMASAYRIRQFVCEHALKAYLVPAGMYASQVWGTEYAREDKELLSGLQVRHMSFKLIS